MGTYETREYCTNGVAGHETVDVHLVVWVLQHNYSHCEPVMLKKKPARTPVRHVGYTGYFFYFRVDPLNLVCRS